MPQTILKIANNILSSDDPKFRTLKASNPTLKNKVLSAVGAHEYLIAVRIAHSYAVQER